MSWTEEVLAELRAARYAPVAWQHLLARSFVRAAEVRRERRHAHRQTLLLALLGLGVWVPVAFVGRPWLALAGALWWGLVALMVDWHLALLGEQRRLGLANVLTILRAGVVPALVALPPLALAAALAPAGVLDGIDGPIARARGECTDLGRWLDGSVDGLVLGAAAVGAARAGVLPAWVVALVLARHGLQWLAVAAAYFIRARPPALDALVPARLPGLVLFAGLSLAALGLQRGAALVAVGAAGGLVTFARTLARSRTAAAAS